MTWNPPADDWRSWPLDKSLGAKRAPVDPYATRGTARAVIGTVPVYTDKASGRSVWDVEETPTTPAMHVTLRTHIEDVQTIGDWLTKDKARTWVEASVKCAPFEGWPQLRITCALVRTLFENGAPGAFRELVEHEAMNQWVAATSCPSDLDPGDAEVVAYMEGCKARARGETLTEEPDHTQARCPYVIELNASKESQAADTRVALAWNAGVIGGEAADEWTLMKLREAPVDSSRVDLSRDDDA